MFVATSIVICLLVAPACINGLDMNFLDYAGAVGTQHGRDKDDPNFFQTNSKMPLLPMLEGYMGSLGKQWEKNQQAKLRLIFKLMVGEW